MIYVMPTPERHDTRTCNAALTRAFQFLGKRWTGVLLASLTDGPASFTELKRAVVGISDSVLSDRLSDLTQTGLAQRVVHEGPPVTIVYSLTTAGEALLPAMKELGDWASVNLPEQSPCT
ncbi:HxlR family transcriptional regulator [Rudaeicoccus suwonensis]|uniref:HxlR family transcriptional regulator n=2 Tax=Rudaeicoccus suwonensis TaxID=657409 RepID=A0A561E3P0_9MICO|nr:HxlR family transcriptional regulator [Rudaeicoccus suwonensis]